MEQQSNGSGNSQVAWGVIGVVALAALVLAFFAVSRSGAF
jgi:hypothetical protein